MKSQSTVSASTVIIAISGIKGSFTEEAALKFCGDHHFKGKFVYSVTPEKAFDDVATDKAELGIVPLTNSAGGIVVDTIRSMGQHLFDVKGLLEIDVQQNLMTLPAVQPKTIKKIVSHPQAFSQSKIYLAKNWPNAERVAYSNTALAAKDLAAGKLGKDVAVIGSERAASLFGLKIIAPSIQDARFNFTTFMVFEGNN